MEVEIFGSGIKSGSFVGTFVGAFVGLEVGTFANWETFRIAAPKSAGGVIL